MKRRQRAAMRIFKGANSFTFYYVPLSCAIESVGWVHLGWLHTYIVHLSL